MAVLEVTTKSAEEVWKSPDGKITMFKLLLDFEGKPFEAKTYSKAIATEGWSGEVESYEKAGKNGTETFVKQPQKEGGWQGSGSGSGGGGKSFAKPQDQFTMFLSYAKDLASFCVADGKFDPKLYAELLESVAAGGAQLYAARPTAEPEAKAQVDPKVKEQFEDAVLVTEDDLDLIGKLPL